MTRSSPAIALCLSLVACNRTPQERRDALQLDLREQVDALYAQFGEGAATGIVKSLPQGGGKDGLVESAKGTATALAEQYDRAAFEAYCTAVGRGEQPLQVSSRLYAFMKEERHRSACQKVAALQRQVQAVEEEVRTRGGTR